MKNIDNRKQLAIFNDLNNNIMNLYNFFSYYRAEV